MSLEGDIIGYTYGGNEDHCFGMDINFGDILTGHTQSTVNWDTYTLKLIMMERYYE